MASRKPKKPAMIPVAKPWTGAAEARAARRPLMSGWVTQGPEVAAFEKEFAAYVGAAHACAVSSCTTALHLALKAVGVKAGDEVITASHSFIATANAIRYCDAVPVFVDIERSSFNLDPSLIERAISPKTRAILVVHQIGMPAHLGEILPIAKRRGLPVIEDAACAIGSEIRWDGKWEKIGRPHADIACFSFHPRKLVTTGDGGMLTTNDPLYDAKFRRWRQHSMSVPDTARHAARSVIFEQYNELGYNYRMTDIQAAVGREQLKRLPQMLKRRRQLAERYARLLRDVPGLIAPSEPAWARTNWQSYCVLLPLHADQLEVMQHMLERGVSTRRAVMCAHREPAFAAGREPWSCGPGGCPSADGYCDRLKQSEYVQDRGIILPLYHQMTTAQQDHVVAALRETCTAHGSQAHPS
jgi:dTDP-4-amino-4,6-dideoxygalactose transaminase